MCFKGVRRFFLWVCGVKSLQETRNDSFQVYWGYIVDNGKENGNHYIIGVILGLYRDSGKENPPERDMLDQDFSGFVPRLRT